MSFSLFFFCSFFDLLDCSWSNLLFISAMIKPFEFIKVLVSSVCTVPNARNTRRSTALGETPLIWYCARYPEPSNSTVDSVSVGCGCGTQRGSVHCCVPSVTFSDSLLHAQFNGCFFLFAKFSQQFQGNWRPAGNPSFDKGVRFLKFQSLLLQSATIQKWKKQNKQKKKNKRETSSGGHRVWTEKGLWCILHNVTVMKLKFFFLFLQKWLTVETAGLHDKSEMRIFNKAPVRKLVSKLKMTRWIWICRCQWLGATGQTRSCEENGDTQRAWKIIFSQLICYGSYQKMRLDFDLQKRTFTNCINPFEKKGK